MHRKKQKPPVFMLAMLVTETQAVCLDISVSPEKCLAFLNVCPDSFVIDLATDDIMSSEALKQCVGFCKKPLVNRGLFIL